MNRENKDTPYLVGRMCAIVEHYAGKKFGPNTLVTMMKSPAYSVSVFAKYVPMDDEYWQELAVVELPNNLAPVPQSQVWVGYYHQKAAYTDCNADRIRIGNRLRELREAQGLTTTQLGERCCLTQSTISKVENGKWSVSLDILSKVCEALGAKVEIVM